MRKLLMLAVSSALAFIVGCGTDPDTDPPTVVSTSPPAGYDSASVDEPITAVLSEPIDPYSVDTSKFMLGYPGPILILEPPVVKGALTVQSRRVMFRPDTDLYHGTEYVAMLKAGIRDMAGNAMASDYTWSFTTIEYDPGSSWIRRESGTQRFLWGIDRSHTRFVAVGSAGEIIASPNGIDWDSVSTDIDKTLLDILWTGEQFVAVGKDVIATSSDGLSWTEIRGIDIVGDYSLEGVASSGDKLVAVDSRFGRILSSTDGGESWIEESDSTSDRIFWEITWSGSIFVAVGAVIVEVSPTLHQIVAMVATSEGDSQWSYIDLGIVGDLYDVTWTGSQLVAVGGETLPVGGGGAMVVTSPDGVTWTKRNAGIIDPLFAVRSVDTTVMAVGFHGKILTSKNGIEWTERSSGVSNALYGIASFEERVVVVGTEGTILTSP